jgi:hypothetical protein
MDKYKEMVYGVGKLGTLGANAYSGGWWNLKTVGK